MTMHRRMNGNTIIVEDTSGNAKLFIDGVVEKKTLVFYLRGTLDTDTIYDFEDEIVAASIACENLILDFEQINYLSNSAMKILLQIQHLVDEKDGNMVLRNLSGYVKDAFETKGLMDLFIIE